MRDKVRDKYVKKFLKLASGLRPDLSYEELVSEVYGSGLADMSDDQVRELMADFVVRYSYCEDGGTSYNEKLKVEYEQCLDRGDFSKAMTVKKFKEVFNRYYPE